MSATGATPVISERAFALSLRLRIADLDDEMHAAIRPSAIPDRMADPPDVAAAWVYGAYAVALSRLPDDGGLADFRRALAAGLPPTAVLQELRNSTEGRHARSKTPADPRDVFVVGCHLMVFGRSPSRAELLDARAALDRGELQDDYLTGLATSPAARRALRFPPQAPDRNGALAIAIQRATGHPEVESVTARLRSELFAGASVVVLLRGELDRHARTLLARLRARLALQSLAAHAEAIAAGMLAQQESALTRDLVWRLTRDEWQRTASREVT